MQTTNDFRPQGSDHVYKGTYLLVKFLAVSVNEAVHVYTLPYAWVEMGANRYATNSQEPEHQ